METDLIHQISPKSFSVLQSVAGPSSDQVKRDCFSAPSSQCSNLPKILIRLHDNYMAPRATAPRAVSLGRSWLQMKNIRHSLLAGQLETVVTDDNGRERRMNLLYKALSEWF
ncbi:hypothetical protein EVAR_67681_1 [Eumeta japonica]|uniref:Uncharacterized protein n=1 Tax=Eumeta variegata TaxID=151549 RepID=A0A4C1ZKK6_EUMVA|nr:hypothetical protein EVAR_67681_1 [Eumeta japonica]